MFDISKKIDDKLVLNNNEYRLLLSFDNVLWVFEMWQNKDVPVEIKPQLALAKLTGDVGFKDMNVEEALNVYSEIFEKHIKVIRASDNAVRYDLDGNVMPNRPQETELDDEEPLFNIKYDSEYIFSSFMQAYRIDLIEEQGKLHWQKFNALLSGLPDGTKLVEVMKIRAWKPQKGDSAKEKSRMKQLQKQYALPREYDEEDDYDY